MWIANLVWANATAAMVPRHFAPNLNLAKALQTKTRMQPEDILIYAWWDDWPEYLPYLVV